MPFFKWSCQKCDILKKKQNELIKYAIMIKKIKEELKTRSTKIKKTLVEKITSTDINLYITGGLFPPVFSETAPEVERTKKK